ncbi:VOC family protein [Haladaptatus sp. DYSN1]|uniref:VOC family protein n=1 Tax=unclassified Haladaptatus TaxID=2622732 RepID=UPI00240502DA|nr:VOC family protein [Haladaptatus sp. DYSN1]
MIERLAFVTVYVEDQDDALDFYTNTLGFTPREDVEVAPGVRWVTVTPWAQQEVAIALEQPNDNFHGPETAARMRQQIGNGTPWAYTVHDCRGTVERLAKGNVTIRQRPVERRFGLEAVIEDLYGNPLLLVEPDEPID